MMQTHGQALQERCNLEHCSGATELPELKRAQPSGQLTDPLLYVSSI